MSSTDRSTAPRRAGQARRHPLTDVPGVGQSGPHGAATVVPGPGLSGAGAGGRRSRRRGRRIVARRRPPGRTTETFLLPPGRTPGVRGGWVRRPVPLAVRSSARGLRLSMRGRRVLAGALALTVLWVVGAVLGAVLSAAGSALLSGAGDPAAGDAIVVQAGDTLWAVAERSAPGQDPRRVVAELQQLNGLRGGQLQAGQLLVLPAR